MNKLEAEQNQASETVRLQETPEQELLPCPFCGHEADGRGRFEDHTIVWHTLTCCTAHKCKIAGIAFTVDEWNTRSDAAQQETIAALTGALKLTLAAMRNARDTWPNYAPDVQWVEAWDAARAAIKKANQ